MTRVAAIDCGTNSVRLLVAEGAPDGRLIEVDRALELTRLGQGVDATGQFHPDALARTLAAVGDFAVRIRSLGVQQVRMVATSAARDAGNRDEFFAGVRERLGVPAEVISGDEEAWLSFLGALNSRPDVDAPVVLMDIGGGSTELVVGSVQGGVPVVEAGGSLDIGSVRIRERFLATDPPTTAEIGAACEYVDELLDGSGVDIAGARTWMGVGGTVTSLSALHQQLPIYDRTRVHGSRMTVVEVVSLAERLLTLPVAAVREFPTMPAQRADVICAGALIASRVARRSQVDLLISEADILDGIALGLLSRSGGVPA